MSLDHFLDLFFKYNIIAIEILFGVVLLSIIFLTVRMFTLPESHGSEVSLNGLEDGLKKMIEQMASGNAGGGNSGHPPAIDGDGNGIMEEMLTQIERLKLQVVQKQEEIDQLKSNPSSANFQPASVAAAAASNTNGATSSSSESAKAPADASSAALTEKIKDLEARLNEYSIIEDDIADLSFYKEASSRLQTEVDALKKRIAELEAALAAAQKAPKTTSAAVEPNKIDTNDSALTEELESVSTEPLAEEPTEEPSVESLGLEPLPETIDEPSIDDDIMAEFERAVAEQKELATAKKEAKTASKNKKAEDEILKNAMPSKNDEESLGAKDGGSVTNEDEINIDKMMSEVGELPDQPNEDLSNALEQALDTEKLLQEATGMDKVDNEALNDFDEFLKKEGA